MTKKVVQFSWMFAAAMFMLFTACEKDGVTVTTDDVEYYTEGSMVALDSTANCGKRGCYEFVFPVSIVFPNGDSTEVDSYQDMRSAIRSWKEANTDATEKPHLAFPIEVTDEEGTIITVENRMELQRLRMKCRRDKFKGRRHGKGDRHEGRCFKPVFPLYVSLPGVADPVEVIDGRDLKNEVRVWKKSNPDSEERPTLVFPITVELEDGTTQVVNSADEMQALKESCSTD